jgi:hypothetical protein
MRTQTPPSYDRQEAGPKRMLYVDHIKQKRQGHVRRDLQTRHGRYRREAISPYRMIRGGTPWIKIKESALHPEGSPD